MYGMMGYLYMQKIHLQSKRCVYLVFVDDNFNMCIEVPS
jgi:hypothetical protein